MPQQQKNKRNKKQNNEKKVSSTRGNVWTSLTASVPLFPVMKRVTLKYYEFSQSVTAGIGTATTRFFSCNGIYDPDITGTGHQPMGFDQMMLLYDQYTVINARVTATFCGGGSPSCGGIYLNPDTTAITDIQKLVENGLVDVKHVDAGGNGPRIAPVTKSVNMAKYFGRPNDRSIVNDAELHGTAAANPVEQVYFGIAAWDFIAATAAQVYYDLVIEYDTIFTEPRKLAPS